MDYNLFITQGKKLGYADEALQEFVTQRVEIEREKRKQDKEKREAERVERNAQRELEKLKLETQKEIELERIQNEKLKIQQDHELEGYSRHSRQPSLNISHIHIRSLLIYRKSEFWLSGTVTEI